MTGTGHVHAEHPAQLAACLAVTLTPYSFRPGSEAVPLQSGQPLHT